LVPDAYTSAGIAVFPGPEGQSTFNVPISVFFLKKKTLPIDPQNLELGELVDLPPEDDWTQTLRDIAAHKNYD
jgi:hypothetical protein